MERVRLMKALARETGIKGKYKEKIKSKNKEGRMTNGSISKRENNREERERVMKAQKERKE